MPFLSRWAIRIAFLYLLLGLLGWTVATANLLGYLDGTWYALRPVSIHWITIGWLTQLIFAVIYWMFPIVTRERPYGHAWVVWAGYITLNIGLLLRAVFEIGMSRGMDADVAGWGLVVSANLQWLAATLLIIGVWPRIKPRGGKK